MPPIGIISIATFQATISQGGLSEIRTINLSVPATGQELYDLATDPFENSNLLAGSAGYSDIVSELSAVADGIRQTDTGDNGDTAVN